MNKQKGFSVAELMGALCALTVTFVVFGGVVYVAFHFIAKFW